MQLYNGSVDSTIRLYAEEFQTLSTIQLSRNLNNILKCYIQMNQHKQEEGK